jgi:uncharacterized protein YbbC (DUF1343 family)
MPRRMIALLSLTILAGCHTAVPPVVDGPASPVRPGLAVLLDDSIHVIRGRRIGLITNQTGVDQRRQSAIDLLGGQRARAAGADLVRLYSPEHGIRGTEDRTNLADEVDARTGLQIVSLYGATTMPPPDSTLRDIQVLVFDLQDIGTRTWTYVGVMLYAMQSAARLGIPFVVLDRPNPISGLHASGPLLDSAIANPYPHTAQRPGRAYALWPMPLRHGLTMGEMARFYNAELAIGAQLHVIPAAGWRRGMWYDQTGLPWVRPSPNMPDLMSALIYPSLVAFEGSNVSVGRGTPDAFQRFGAPWLRAGEVARLLEERRLPGVRFVVDSFTPRAPGDNKYPDRLIPGVRIEVTDRDRVRSGELGAAVLWAIHRTSPDSLRITDQSFDLRFGSRQVREAILGGEDFQAALARHQPAANAFAARAAPYLIYR